mgnify:CR=1 FL=1
MKAAVWVDYNKIELRDVPVPELGPGEVLVKVHSAGVCATDLEVITGRFRYGRPPHILGHEIAGEVAAVGSQVAGAAQVEVLQGEQSLWSQRVDLAQAVQAA